MSRLALTQLKILMDVPLYDKWRGRLDDIPSHRHLCPYTQNIEVEVEADQNLDI